jgi:hypothetical protein
MLTSYNLYVLYSRGLQRGQIIKIKMLTPYVLLVRVASSLSLLAWGCWSLGEIEAKLFYLGCASISAQLLVCPKRAKLPSYLAFYLCAVACLP